MRALVYLSSLLLGTFLAPLATAQAFPAPGAGAFTWERVGTDPPGYGFKPEALVFAADGTLRVSSDTAYVFLPAPGGAPAGRWRRLGLPSRTNIEALLSLDAHSDTLLAGIEVFIHRSLDGGATWRRVTGATFEGGMGGPSRAGGFLELPTGHPHAGRILAGPRLFSDDRGATWALAGFDLNEFTDAHAFVLLPSGRVLYVGYWGVAASDDGGASYARSPLYGGYHYEIDGIAALATPGSRQAGTPACGLSDGALCDGAIAVGVDAFGDGTYAWRSNDGGRSWSEAVHLAQPDDGIGYGIVAGVVGLGPGPDGLGRAIAVLGRGIVYQTADGGQTWQVIGRLPMDRMLPELPGSDYAKHVTLGPDGHLWVVLLQTGRSPNSIYRSAEPALSAFPVASEAPPRSGESRIEVLPNPASGRASVRLVTEAQPSQATVSVYDALGRRVAVLHDGPLAAGAHTFTLDTSGMPSGTYVVRTDRGGARTFTVSR